MSRSRGHSGSVRRSAVATKFARTVLVGILGVFVAGIVTAALLTLNIGTSGATATVTCGTGSFTVAGSSSSSPVIVAPQSNNYAAWVGAESGSPTCTIPQAPSSLTGSVSLTSISCPAANFCVAVDNSGNAYVFNGSTWSAATSVTSHALNDVSCPSSSFCTAVDSSGNAYTYNGAWSSATSVSSNGLNGVSCTSSNFCMAVDSSGGAFRYNGTSWSSSPTWTNPIDSNHVFSSVSCTSSSFCIAVDNFGDALGWNGSDWTTLTATWSTVIDSGNALTAVSCTSSTFCIAVDTVGNAFGYNGTNWTTLTATWSNAIDPSHSLKGVSCTTISTINFCVAVDGNGNALVYNGTSWTTFNTVSPHGFNAVSCNSTTFCTAIDQNGSAFSYTGVWSSSTAVSSHAINSVSCTSSTFCMAVDSNGDAYAYNGTNWTTLTTWTNPIDSGQSLKGVSCVSNVFCMAVDNGGNAFAYNGTDWTTLTTWSNPVDSSHGLNAISCTTATFCVAGDNGGKAFAFTGTWSAAQTTGTSHPIKGVSCPTVTFCIAVDNQSNAFQDNPPGTWAAAGAVSSHIVEGVSCTTTTFCIAVDNNGSAFDYNGTDWTTVPSVSLSSHALNSVSCTSTSFCVTVDTSGSAFLYTGSTTGWSAAESASSTQDNAVACASTTFCVAGDNSGNVNLFSGIGWTGATAVSSNKSTPLNAISCPTTGFCAAVDNGGNAFDYNGSWSAALPVSSHPLEAVSCTASNFCIAVDDHGDAFEYNGSTWSPTLSWSNPISSHALNGVSCVSLTFCMAVDSNGDALQFNGTTWGQNTPDTGTAINGVSCVAGPQCVLVDNSGAVIIFSGSFTKTPSVSTHPFDAVSCATTAFCIAVDNNGTAFAYNGASWAATSVSSHALNSVSCTSVTFCMAVDSSGNAYGNNGASNATNWTTLTSNWSNPITSNSLTGVSCVSPTNSTCFAVDNKGDPIFFGGTSWSTSGVTISAATAGQFVQIDDSSGALANSTTCTGTFTMQLASGATNTLQVLDDNTTPNIDDSVAVSTGGVKLSKACASPDISFPGSTSFAVQDVVVVGQPTTGNLLDLSADTSSPLTVTANDDSNAAGKTQGLVTGFPSSSAALTQVQFSGEQTVTGAGGSEPTDFVAGTTGITFNGATGANNELDISAESPANFSSIAVGMNSGTTNGGLSSQRTIPSATVSANGTTATLTDPNGSFTPADVGRTVSTTGSTPIPGGTTISSFTNATTVTLAPAFTGTGSESVTVAAASSNPCPSSSYGELVAGSGSTTATDCFTNIGLVNGPSSIPTDFQPDSSLAGTPTIVPVFNGNDNSSGASVVNLDTFTTTATVNLNGDTSGAGAGTVTKPGGTTITYAKFNGVNEVLGATGQATTFRPGTTTTNVDFIGQSGTGSLNHGDVVDLSGENSTNFGSGASFTVAMTSTSNNCTAGGSGEVTSASGTPQNIDDCFSGVSNVVGAALLTDFIPNAAGGVTFTGGTGLNNELDLSTESPGSFSAIALGMNSGNSNGGLSSQRTIPNATVTGTTTLNDPNGSFTPADVNRAVTGLSAGTTISAFNSATSVTLSTPVTNTTSPVSVTVGSLPNPCPTTPTAYGELVGGTGSSTATDCFVNIGLLNGATSVPTAFEPDPTLQTTPSIVPLFVGNDTAAGATVIDLDRFTAQSTANLNSDTPGTGVGSVTAKPGSTTVTYAKFDGVNVVLGATGQPTSFRPGTSTTNVNFIGQSGTGSLGHGDTVDLSQESTTNFGSNASFTVSMTSTSNNCSASGGEVTSAAGTPQNIDDCFTGISNVIGAALLTDFIPNAAGGVTFTGGSGLSNELDISGESSSNFGGIALGMNSGSSNGGLSSQRIIPNATVTGTTTLNDPNGSFTAADVNRAVSGLSTGTTISSFISATSVTLSTPVTNTTNPVQVTLGSTSNPCPTTPTAFGELEAWSGTATVTDCFENIGLVNGATNVPTAFEPDPTLTSTPSIVPVFVGNNTGGAGSVIDLNRFTAAPTANLNSDTSGGAGTVTARPSSTTVNYANFTGVNEVLGATTHATDFEPGTTPSPVSNKIKLVGQSGSDTVDLSPATSGTFGANALFTVLMDVPSGGGSCAGEGEVKSVLGTPNNIDDCFSFVYPPSSPQTNTIVGAHLQTTFQPANAKSATFTGESGSDVLDLTEDTATSYAGVFATDSFTVAMAQGSGAPACAGQGEVSDQAAVLADCFTGILTIEGAGRPTSFQPNSVKNATFIGETNGSDTLDLTNQGSGFESFTVDMKEPTTSSTCPNQGEVSSAGTIVLGDCFTGISIVDGATTVPTTFQPSTATATFVGSSLTTDVLDVSGASIANFAGLKVAMSGGTATQCNTAVVGQLKSTPGSPVTVTDPFCNISQVNGAASVPTTFVPDPNLATDGGIVPTFVGNDAGTSPPGSVVDVSSFTQPLNVILNGDSTGSIGVVQGVSNTQDYAFFAGINEEVGTFSNPTTLQLPSSDSKFTVDVHGDIQTSPGDVTGLSGGTNAFYGMSTITGNQGTGGTQFNADEVMNGANPFTVEYDGRGQGQNSLSFTPLNIGATASLTIDAATNDNATISSSGTPIAKFNSSVTQFGGCNSGTGNCSTTTFDAGSGTTFLGDGAPNTISFASLGEATQVTESNSNGTATPSISFSDVQTFVGSGHNDTFTIGANTASETFNAGGGSVTANFGSDAGVSITLAAPSGGVEAAAVTGGAGHLTLNNFTTFIGSSQGGNTFTSDGFGGHVFQAGGSSNVLDYSQATNPVTVDDAGTCLSVLPNCVNGLTANTVLGSSTSDGISGMTVFDGSPSGTTFQSSGSVNGLQFLGVSGATNKLDLTNGPGGGTTITDRGSSTGSATFSNGNANSFVNISQFLGSGNGGTTFNPQVSGNASLLAGSPTCGSITSSTPTTFLGQGQTSSNTVVLSTLDTSTTPAIVQAPNLVVAGGTAPNSVCLGDPNTGSAFATFAGIGAVDGPPTGNTTFNTGQSGGFAFHAEGSANTLSYANVTGVQGVTVNLSSDQVSCTGGVDTFSGISTVIGTPNADLFQAGPSQVSIDGGAGNDTLNFAGAQQPIALTMAAGVATVTGGFGPTITATHVETFSAPSVDGNSFTTDATGGFNFDAAGGTTDNSLSIQSVTSAATINVTSVSGNGTVTGAGFSPCPFAGNVCDNFTSIQNFTGNGANDELSFNLVRVGVTFQLSSTTQTVASTSGTAIPGDVISGFTTYDGSSAGDNVFATSAQGGYTFNGGGTGNTLDLSATPSNTTVNQAASQVTGLKPGIGSSTVDNFSDMQTFIGTEQGGSTNFAASCNTGGTTFTGTGASSTLTFPAACTATGPVVINAVNGTISLPAAAPDSFSGIKNFDGPPSGSTTFVVPGTGSYTFVGGVQAGSGLNTLDGSSLPANTIIDDSNPAAGTAGTVGQDTFSSVACFVGSSGGSTTLKAAATPTPISSITDVNKGCDEPGQPALMFVGLGNGNTLSLSALSAGAPGSAFAFSATAGSTTVTRAGGSFTTADIGSTVTATGAGIAGGTTIAALVNGNPSEAIMSQPATSTITPTVADKITLTPNLAVCQAPGAIPLVPCPALGTPPPGGGQVQVAGAADDNFADVATIAGSGAGHTIFVPADAPGLRFVGGGTDPTTNYLSLLATGKGTILTTTPAVVDLDGSTTNTLSFTNIGNFVGSSFGSTTFKPDASTSYTFTGWQSSSPSWQGAVGGSSGNKLDLSNAPAGTNVTVAATGNVTLGSAATDVFSGISSFVGSTSGSTQFIAPSASPAGGITYTGQGQSNSLSFANLATVTPTAGGSPQSITGRNFTINLNSQTAGVPTVTKINSATIQIGTNTLTCLNGGSNGSPCAPTNAVGSTVSAATGIPAGTTILFSTPNQSHTGFVMTLSQNATASTTEAVTLNGTFPVATFAGIQTITGAAVSDTFLDGRSATTIIDPSAASDTLSFAGAPAAGTVNLQTGSATGGFGGALTIVDLGTAGSPPITVGGIQNVICSPRGMTVTGNGRPSTFTEGSGANTFTLIGNAGSPGGMVTTIQTPNGLPTGNNTLRFTPAKPVPIEDSSTASFNLGASTNFIPSFGSVVFGPGARAQTVIGANDGNLLQAGSYSTTLIGGTGNVNVLRAGGGNDTLKAGGGPTTMIGGSGTDIMVGAKGQDLFKPGTGGGSITDTLGTGTLDEANASGTVLANLGTSAFTVKRLATGPGIPNPYPPHVAVGRTLAAQQVTVLNSSGKAGTPYSLNGIVNLDGSTHGDVLVGSTSSNVINAGRGTNIVVGQGGGDTLKVCLVTDGKCGTAAGVNTFTTGSGNNTVIGSTGGDNWIDYSGASSGINVNLKAGTAKNGYGGTDSLTNIENVIGSANSDVIKLGSRQGTIFAGNGNGDDLEGSTAGHDKIYGGSGGDTFTVQGPDDFLFGASGNDSFFANVHSFVTWIEGGGGFNIAFVNCADIKAVPKVKESQGSRVISVPSGGFPGVLVGMFVSGPGFNPKQITTVTAISGNRITLSRASAKSSTVTLKFTTYVPFTIQQVFGCSSAGAAPTGLATKAPTAPTHAVVGSTVTSKSGGVATTGAASSTSSTSSASSGSSVSSAATTRQTSSAATRVSPVTRLSRN